jgi:intracellular sulfur oxidation DsrE/DsrF family protein
MRRVLSFVAVAVFALVLLSPAAPAAPAAHAEHAAHAAKKYRILLEWPEADTTGQFIMTKHVGNLLDDLGQDNVQLEVIAYGFATQAVTTTRPQTLQASAIADLSKRGVVFHVCRHAMDFFKVQESELLPQVTPVKGAMWYIATKHAEGWQILRP